MYLLAFRAFLRIGEIAVTSTAHSSCVLQFNQISLSSDKCTVVFHSYKHYQGPPVSLVISAHADSSFCRINAIQAYLAVRRNAPGPLFIFPGGTPVTKAFIGDQLEKSLA